MPRKPIKFSLDFMKKDIFSRFTVKQFDDVTLTITPLINNEPYNVSNMACKIYVGVNNEMYKQDTNITVSSNSIVVTLDKNMLANDGRAYAEIELTDSQGTVTSSSFIFDIDRKIGEGATIPGAIEGFVEKYKKLTEEFKSQVNNAVLESENRTTDAINNVNINVDNKINDIETRFQTLTTEQQQDAEVIEARKGENSLKAKMDKIDEQFNTIAYLLPATNGVDDTEIIQNALNNYKKIQLNGKYIVSNLVVNNDVEICGKNKRNDIITQKSGSVGNLITVNQLLSLNNVTIKGNNEAGCSGIVYLSKSGESYAGTGNINNCEILNFKDYGLKLEGNRNMLHAYEVGITGCGTGLYIESSDNLLSKINIGDCNYNVYIKKGGGNVFDSCALYRSNECCVWLGHEVYYSTFSNTSIDSNKKQSVYIQQVDSNISERGHKFIACSFFGNSLSSSGTYNCFELDGAKGVIIQGCNFFVYDDIKVKYLVNITNNGYAIMLGNSYNNSDKKPFSISYTNDTSKVSVVDFNANIFNANISINGGKRVGFTSPDSYSQILQSFISGESYARLQIYSDGRIIFGNGKSNASIRFEVFDENSLKLSNANLFISKKLGVGNTESATTLGTLIKKFEIVNENGVSMGYIPIYNSIS